MSCFSLQDIGACGCTCTLQVQVKGCGSAGSEIAVSSGLTVDLKVGGSTIYTGTTNSSGLASFTGVAGTYDVVVTDSRTPSRWNTQTFSSSSLTCGGTTNVILNSVKTGFTCTNWCGEPIADTLYCTDVNGTWTLTQTSGYWKGCASGSIASVVTALAPGTCAATVGTGTVNYVLELGSSASLPAATALNNLFGVYAKPGSERLSATPTCASGAIDVTAGIPAFCIGAIASAAAGVVPSYVCPVSLSITGTMPSTFTYSGASVAVPGGGAFTITE